ncbi:hypothetical protein AAur_pTC10006 (plasmid) [Paenarthrobacter aurescens TC1]|uniref:Uncharacterized protein n=1 Tax=Paenarthrobacter aurescens (strain TC1) TaxID=290340 RepID=A1RCB8_PAEAT|nr:hypothetical protein AAur_pTC10006 [Paenarthrobacter aurescens TC1]
MLIQRQQGRGDTPTCIKVCGIAMRRRYSYRQQICIPPLRGISRENPAPTGSRSHQDGQVPRQRGLSSFLGLRAVSDAAGLDHRLPYSQGQEAHRPGATHLDRGLESKVVTSRRRGVLSRARGDTPARE